MADIRSFALSLPSLIERSYFISPGVVSVVFKVIWSIFTFLVVTCLLQYGLAAVGIKETQSETESENKQKSLWLVHRDYTRVQNVSNGRWGGMLFNLPSTRVILGFLFWVFIYAFELLFSFSIDNTYITYYNGTNCIGRVDNFTAMTNTDTMWFNDARSGGGNVPAKNSTLLRQLLNQKRAGNFALLGDGIFTISPIDGLYKKNQNINVARAGFNCDNTIYLSKTPQNEVNFESYPGTSANYTISTPHYTNLSTTDLGIVYSGNVNFRSIEKYGVYGPPTVGNRTIFLILVSNPSTASVDINEVVYNSTVFLTECILFYEYGVVTIAEDGYLNETNIGDSYKKVDNATIEALFNSSYIDTNIEKNMYVLSTFDYPDEFLNAFYNKTFSETLKIGNNIIAAHFLNGLDADADLCTFNQEQVPVYSYVLGTRMSFGYIIIGIVFAVTVLFILSVFAFTMFTPEERNQWLVYTNDSRFTGYVYMGDNMNESTFKKYSKNIYIGSNTLKENLDENIDDGEHSDILLRKK